MQPARLQPCVEMPKRPELSDAESAVIAGRLRLARQQLGLNQEAAADELGVDRSTLGRYERGEMGVPLPVLLRAARVFERPLDWFLGDEGPSKENGDDPAALTVFRRLSRAQQRWLLLDVLPTLDDLCAKWARLGSDPSEKEAEQRE